VPSPVVERTKDLFLDWIASAIAGKDAPAVRRIQEFAAAMGPATGQAEVFVDRRRTSPYFAALINGASSHVVEQDDVHNGSVLHPAAVVFPAVVAAAQAKARPARKCCWPRSPATKQASASASSWAARTIACSTPPAPSARWPLPRQWPSCTDSMPKASTRLWAAGTQAAGLWEFLRDAADSKQLHTAKAAADGLQSAWLARAGFTGARQILEGAQGMAAGMSSDANPAALTDGLGTRWATAETSFKFFASCRHTHPAADALKALMLREGLQADQIAAVTAHVQGAIDVLGPVVNPATIHQAKFSMGTVLGLVAVHAHAGLGEFEQHSLKDAQVSAFRDKVTMELDEEINAAYPRQWIGRVTVRTTDGRTLQARVDVPKGDPDNTLSRPELEAKAIQLGAFRHGATEAEMRAIIARVWQLDREANVNDWLPAAR
jgi:2-methylcitrate dehydratase PrpD